MKNRIKTAVLFFPLMALLFAVPAAFAQSAPPTLLPAENADIGGYGDACVNLADRITTGDIHLAQIPCFIKYFSKTLIAIAGSLSVIFVMVGGYQLLLSSSESKEAGKKTITYALIGLAVSLLAWVLVDIVLQVITE